MEASKLEVGDIILSHDKGFLPRAIRWFMWRYAKKLGIKVDKVYNHAGVVVENDGDILVAEAMAKGVQVIKTREEYLEKHPDHLVLKWKDPLKDHEKEIFSDAVVERSLAITKYDIKNFVDQVVLITFGVWKGKKHGSAAKRLYCSELAGYASYKTRSIFPLWWQTNPFDIFINPCFNHYK